MKFYIVNYTEVSSMRNIISAPYLGKDITNALSLFNEQVKEVLEGESLYEFGDTKFIIERIEEEEQKTLAELLVPSRYTSVKNDYFEVSISEWAEDGVKRLFSLKTKAKSFLVSVHERDIFIE